MYHDNPKYWNKQAWASNIDPDQMSQNVTSDQDLHYLPLTQYFFDTSIGNKRLVEMWGQTW